jgi:serine/threonine protein kinase
VHRDVSPSNVLVSLEGEVKLCDFGIARAVTDIAELPEGALEGKAAYMSPEQARGERIDARAVFAAGTSSPPASSSGTTRSLHGVARGGVEAAGDGCAEDEA